MFGVLPYTRNECGLIGLLYVVVVFIEAAYTQSEHLSLTFHLILLFVYTLCRFLKTCCLWT